MAAPLILIAEDDPLSLKLMRDFLEANGYRTIEALTGLAAVVEAKRAKPDAVVLDIGLPSLDGVEAMKQIRIASTAQQIPVIAVTAYAMPGDEERLRQAGCNAYLTKPLRFSDFLLVLRSLVPGEAPELAGY